MARDHARIRLDIWADEDWRELPSLGQWLYLHLLSTPSLGFAGVTDWRPARIAALTADLTAHDVEYAASWLEAGRLIVIDRDTEEALIRSFVKHDGLLRSPNVSKAFVKSHAAVASKILRAVIVGQLHTLREKSPDLAGWRDVETVYGKTSMTVEEAFEILPPNPSGNPSSDPSGNPSEKGSGNPSANRASLRSPFSILHSPNSPASSDLVCNEDRALLASGDGMMPGGRR